MSQQVLVDTTVTGKPFVSVSSSPPIDINTMNENEQLAMAMRESVSMPMTTMEFQPRQTSPPKPQQPPAEPQSLPLSQPMTEEQMIARKAFYNSLIDTANPTKLKKNPVTTLPQTPMVSSVPTNAMTSPPSPSPLSFAVPISEPISALPPSMAAAAVATSEPAFVMPSMMPVEQTLPPLNFAQEQTTFQEQTPFQEQPQQPISEKKLTEEEIADRKSQILDEIREYSEAGIVPAVPPKTRLEDMPVDQLEGYLKYCEDSYDDQVGCMILGKGYIAFIGMLEMVNERFDPLGKITGNGLKLRGATKKINKHVNRFNVPFTRIYRKYLKTKTTRVVSPFFDIVAGTIEMLREVHDKNMNVELQAEADKMVKDEERSKKRQKKEWSDSESSDDDDDDVEEPPAPVAKKPAPPPPMACPVNPMMMNVCRDDGFDPTNAHVNTKVTSTPKAAPVVSTPKPAKTSNDEFCITIPKSPKK